MNNLCKQWIISALIVFFIGFIWAFFIIPFIQGLGVNSDLTTLLSPLIGGLVMIIRMVSVDHFGA